MVCCVLYLLGIKWGLPSSDLKKYCPVEVVVSENYIKQSWHISKEKPEDKLPRSAFNIIRSLHPDEQNILKSISTMSPEKLDFNPPFFEYPSCQIYLVAITLKMVSVMKFVHLSSDISYYFNHPEEMGKIYFSGRLITVIMALCGVILFSIVAISLYGKKGGLFATACLGLSPLYVINSHYMTVDIPMVFWMIVSLFLMIKFMRTEKFLFLYLASFFTGVAAGTKYPAATMFFLLPFVYFAKHRRLSLFFIKSIFILLAIFLLGFFITTPYALLSFQEFKRDLIYQASARGVGTYGLLEYIYSFSGFFSGLWTGIWLIFILAICGIFLQAKRRNASDRIVLTGFLLMIIPLMSAGGFKYARYYLLVLPFLSLSAGALFDEMLQCKSFPKKFFVVSVCGVFILGSMAKSFAYSLLMNKKDVRFISAEYIDSEIPSGAKIMYTKDPWIFEVPPVNPLKH
ncbi:MAG TPA: glycosyltransferase family 39 protein, partial [bacterium]|nr:glycosyltransferase family 39 protein [bacterium]